MIDPGLPKERIEELDRMLDTLDVICIDGKQTRVKVVSSLRQVREEKIKWELCKHTSLTLTEKNQSIVSKKTSMPRL